MSNVAHPSAELLEIVEALIVQPTCEPLVITSMDWEFDQVKFGFKSLAESVEQLDKRVRELEEGRKVLVGRIVNVLRDMRAES